MAFGFFKNLGKSVAREVNAAYSGNMDFLEGVLAAVALVAAADGEVEPEERKAAIELVSNHSQLSKLYTRDQIVQTAEKMFGLATSGVSGKQQLARELDDCKGKENSRQMLDDIYLTAADIAAADGEVEPQEKDVLEKIARRLGVDVSQFDFV